MRLKEPGMHYVGSVLSLLLLVISTTSFASPKFKYYGQTFYEVGLDTDKPSVTPEEGKKFVRRILGAYHERTNSYDRILKECENSSECYRQKKLDYSKEVRPAVMAVVDSDDLEGPLKSNVKVVITPYCNKTYRVRYNNGHYDIPDHTNFNVEHTFPKSRFKKHPYYDLMVGDLHNLYPVDSETNSKRGSFFFNDLPGQGGLNNCQVSKLGQIDGRFFFEPQSSHKGNVARAMMYFSLRYGLPLMEKELQVLLNWHRIDPVDEKEQRRAQRIYKIQRNRNPFIDYPHLAEFIGNTLLTSR